MPDRIIIVRHAEKPEKNGDAHLALRGKMRAIGLSKILPDFINPDFIFASTSTKNSKRPYQTIHPTAKKLGLKVCTKFADKETKKLVEELKKDKYKGSHVLICWHHGEIPTLLKNLGYTSPYKKWPEEVFDRIIEISGHKLSNLPQHLLYGDSDH